MPDNIQFASTILRVGARLHVSDLPTQPNMYSKAVRRLIVGLKDTDGFKDAWGTIARDARIFLTEPGAKGDFTVAMNEWRDLVVPFGMGALKTADTQLFGEPFKVVGRTTVTFRPCEDGACESSAWFNLAFIRNGDANFVTAESEQFARFLLDYERVARKALPDLLRGYTKAMVEIAGDTSLFARTKPQFGIQARDECLMVSHTDSKTRAFDAAIRALADRRPQSHLKESERLTIQGFERFGRALLKTDRVLIDRNNTIVDRHKNAFGVSFANANENADRLVGFARSSDLAGDAFPQIHAPVAEGVEPWETYFNEECFARSVSQGKVIDLITLSKA